MCVVYVIYLSSSVVVFPEMGADAGGDGFGVYDRLPAFRKRASIHRQLAVVLVLVSLRVARLFATKHVDFFITSESRRDFV